MPTPQHALICDGRFAPADIPVLTADDRGFSVGWAAFETLRCINGQPISLPRHLARLLSALEEMGIGEPISLHSSLSALPGLLVRNGYGTTEARARVTVTAGRPGGDPRVIVEATSLPPGVLARRRGTALHSRALARGPLAHLKSNGWLPSVMARRGLTPSDEALLVQDGYALECAGGNIAAWVDGALHAPVAGALPGIARAALVEAAVGLGWPIDVGPLPLERLWHAEAVWITSSLLPIAPVTEVDGRKVAQNPSRTAQLHDLMERRLRCELSP